MQVRPGAGLELTFSNFGFAVLALNSVAPQHTIEAKSTRSIIYGGI